MSYSSRFPRPADVRRGDLRPLDAIVADWRDSRLDSDLARPCACGQTIVASPSDPEPGVRAHQVTPRHVEWAAGRFE